MDNPSFTTINEQTSKPVDETSNITAGGTPITEADDSDPIRCDRPNVGRTESRDRNNLEKNDVTPPHEEKIVPLAGQMARQTTLDSPGNPAPDEPKSSTTCAGVSRTATDSVMEAEDILCLLGRCGRYQMLVFFLVSLVSVRGVWQLFGPIFLGADPGHRCFVPENKTFAKNASFVNHSASWRQRGATQCRMPVPGEANTTQPCQYGWVYGDSFTSTFLTQWDFVCDRAYLVDLSSSLFMAGMMIGSLFISPFADKYGRKKILLGALWVQGVLGVAAAFMDNYIVFMVMRFFLGVLNQTIGLVAYVMVPEAFPSSSRTMPYIALFLFWAGGVMSLALLGYLIRDWRHLELAISIPNFLTFVYYWILPESLPWLMARQKYKEAEAVVRKAAQLNRVTLPPEIMNLSTSFVSAGLIEMEDKKTETKAERHQNGISVSLVSEVGCTADGDTELMESSKSDNHSGSHSNRTAGLRKEAVNAEKGLHTNNSGAPVLTTHQTVSDSGDTEAPPGDVLTPDVRSPRSYNVIDLFRTPRMRIYSFIIFYLWLVTSLSYFGISFSVPTLHGDIFLNLFISGLVEVPAYLICMGTVECLGRRRPLCAFTLVCACASIIAIFIPTSTDSGADLTWLKTTLAMVSKFGVTGSYVIVYLFCVEIFPTVVRNLGIGIAAAFETAGGVAAPFIASSAKTIPRLPLTMFGVLTIIGGVLCLALPETHRKPLPETIEEVEGWDRKAGKQDQGEQL